MPKFLMGVLVDDTERYTARLGSASGSANYMTDKEIGKLVKLAGDSRYNLCAAGDNIEGYVSSVESASQDDFSIGTVAINGRQEVMCDGLQATPGTGAIAVGDFVVTGTVTPFGTALTGNPKVCKATVQIGTVPADLTAAGVMVRAGLFSWRVLSLGTVGTGAVGTTAIIKRVGV